MFEKKNTLPSASATLRKREKAPKRIHPDAFLAKLQQEQIDAIKKSRASRKYKEVKKTVEINPETLEQVVIYSRV